MNLTELAARWGIEASYLDIQGRRQDADEETLRRHRRGAVRCAAIRQLPSTRRRGSPSPPIRATAGNAGCWRSSFTGCGRGATGGTAISAISRRLLDIVADLGGAGIGLNPLHAQFYDRPGCSGSPYSPNSRLFLNPLYIDVEAIEEFDRAHAASSLAGYCSVARRRTGRLSADRSPEDRGITRGVSEFCCERQRQAPCRLRRLSGGARPAAANASPPSKRCGSSIPAHGGNGRSHGGSRATTRCAGCAKAIPTKSASTNSCNGTPSASSNAAATSRGGADCPSASISTPRSASTAAAPMPGWTRTWCCADCRSARRPTSSIPPARTGASPRIIRMAWLPDASSRSGRCCARPCAMPARSASTMCSA